MDPVTRIKWYVGLAVKEADFTPEKYEKRRLEYLMSNPLPTVQSDLDLIKARLSPTDIEGIAIIDAIKLEVERLEVDAWKYRDLADDGK